MKWVRVYYGDPSTCASILDGVRTRKEQLQGKCFAYVDNKGQNWFAMLKSFYEKYGEHVVVMRDVIISREGREEFDDMCRRYPHNIVCAPVLMYPATTGLDQVKWEARCIIRDTEEGPATVYWMHTGEEEVDLFGGSCYHMPREVWDRVYPPTEEFLRRTFRWRDDDRVAELNQEYWLGWMAYRLGIKTKVAWKCQTIHLHY